MTLPASGAISLSDVLAELRVANPGRAAPISLGDADVLALAGKSGLPVSMSDLYGKSSYVPMSVVGNSDSQDYDSSISNGTAYAYPSVSVSGGSGGYTYAWSITSQSTTVTLAGADTATCTVSKPYSKNVNGSFDVYLQCVVTDSTGHSVTASGIEAFAMWGNGA